MRVARRAGFLARGGLGMTMRDGVSPSHRGVPRLRADAQLSPVRPFSHRPRPLCHSDARRNPAGSVACGEHLLPYT